MQAMFLRSVIISACLIMLASLTACSSTPALHKPKSGSDSLVFGYIDMTDAPSHLGRVSMKQLRPKTDKPYLSFWVVDGAFFRDEVGPGTYKFVKFGGYSAWKRADFNYAFPEQGKGALDREIDRPGLYYVGSYKYQEVKTGFFEPDKFELVATSMPPSGSFWSAFSPMLRTNTGRTLSISG